MGRDIDQRMLPVPNEERNCARHSLFRGDATHDRSRYFPRDVKEEFRFASCPRHFLLGKDEVARRFRSDG